MQNGNNPTIIPNLRIHPDRINLFSSVEYPLYRPSHDKNFANITGDRETFGRLSMQSSRKLTKAADYLCYLSTNKVQQGRWQGKACKFRLTFVTLTLSSAQKHSDQIIKALFLNQFLTEAKQRWHVTRYVWRSEKQANGSIHFHVLCDKFIPWSELRDTWNRIQNKLGYVDRYREHLKEFHREGFRVRKDLLKFWPADKQYNAWKSGIKTDWNNPNSTDIHGLRHVRNVKKYVCKYLSKNESERQRYVRIKFLHECIIERTPISDEMMEEYDKLRDYFNEGRIWGCSQELSDIKGGADIIDSEIQTELQTIRKSELCRSYIGEHFTVLFIDIDLLEALNCKRLSSIFYHYLYDKFSHSHQIQLEVRPSSEKNIVGMM